MMRQRSHDEELKTSLQQMDILVTRLTHSIVECRQQCEEQRVTCSRWTYLLTESLSLHLFTVQQVLRRPELGGQHVILHLAGLQRCLQAAACHSLLLTLLPALHNALI